MKWIFIACVFASTAAADPMVVHQTARTLFDHLPNVETVSDMGDPCGAGRNTNPHIAYCTTGNTIFISDTFVTRPAAAYEMGHVLGHAVQVRHGVADVALRAIRSRRSEEAALRGMVTRQVECVAGVLTARAGVPAINLAQYFDTEPFTKAHWGRRPVNAGPQVSIGLAARAEWYEIGVNSADFAACTVGEMSADLIVAAAR